MKTSTAKYNMKTSTEKNQERIRKGRNNNGDDVIVKIRYNDNYVKGHKTLTFTAKVHEHGKRKLISCGFCREDIAEAFPDLKPLLKWHLMCTDAPLNYISNTLYYSRDREDMSKPLGVPLKFNTFVKVGNSPILLKELATDWFKLMKKYAGQKLSYEPIYHKKSQIYSPKYVPVCEHNYKEWYQAPFDNKAEAEQWLKVIEENDFQFVKVGAKFNEPIEPDIDGARRYAMWDDATLEQLQSKEELEKRLPKLINDFYEVVTSLGFEY